MTELMIGRIPERTVVIHVLLNMKNEEWSGINRLV